MRVLFARDMQPKLTPANDEAHELRYYNWYKATNPVTVTGDRRLAAWQPQKDSWALGIGLSASLAQLGKIIELTAFVLSVSGDDENGLLIVAEAHLLQNPQADRVRGDPVGRQERSVQHADRRQPHAQALPEARRRTGSTRSPSSPARCSSATSPVVVALGRLSDTRTWFSLTFDFDVWARFFVQFGICFEYSEAPERRQGLRPHRPHRRHDQRRHRQGELQRRLRRRVRGLQDRVERLRGRRSGSKPACASCCSGSCGSASARAPSSATWAAPPSRGELRAQIRLETPWFLPDVTWTFDATFGTLDPAGLATAASRAALVDGDRRRPARRARPSTSSASIPTWTGEGVGRTLSVRELRTMALDEAGRLARFAADARGRADRHRFVPLDRVQRGGQRQHRRRRRRAGPGQPEVGRSRRSTTT